MEKIQENIESFSIISDSKTESPSQAKFIENNQKNKHFLGKIFSIMLIVIGLVLTIFFLISNPSKDKNFSLEETSFSLGGKNISMLLPKNSKKIDSNDTLPYYAASYGQKNIYVPIIIVTFIKVPERTTLNCEKLGKPIISTVNIFSFSKKVDLCEDPTGFSQEYLKKYNGYQSIGTSGFNNDDSDKEYTIEAIVKKEYFQTEEGKAKVKQIIESFSLTNQ